MVIEIRTCQAGDSVEQITRLLNRGYKALADNGLRYVASWQTPEMTAERIAAGICFLAFLEDRLVGTLMLYPTLEDSECDYYCREGVMHFGKFAVEPDLQGQGIGKELHDAAEREARRLGACELACDTADSAFHLIEMYTRWGYSQVAVQDWSLTNYKSVVFAKSLG